MTPAIRFYTTSFDISFHPIPKLIYHFRWFFIVIKLSQRCLMGLRSGDCAGHMRTLKLLFWNHLLASFDVIKQLT